MVGRLGAFLLGVAVGCVGTVGLLRWVAQRWS